MTTTDIPSAVQPPAAKSAGERVGGVIGKDWKLAALFLAPTGIMVAALILFPIIQSVILSTTLRQGVETVFVGADNYTALAKDRLFHAGVRNSFVFTVFAEIFKVLMGLVTALVLHNMRRGVGIAAGLLLLPWVIPTVVSAFTWRALLDPIFGTVNTLFTAIGVGPLLNALGLVPSWPAGWLSDPDLAMSSVIWVNVWKGIPFFTVNFLAGLKAIDTTLHEAAMVDGASLWQRFLHVTLPGLRNVIIVTTLLSSIWTFNNFDLIWLMTQGGPGDATAPYVLVAYTKAIQQLQYGAGAAVTLTMLPVIAVLIVILVRYMRRSQDDRPTSGTTRPRSAWLIGSVVVAATVILLALAAPTILWRVALILGVITLLAIVVGLSVSRLAASGRTVLANGISKVAGGFTLAVLLLLVLFPVYWIIVTAFKGSTQIVAHTSELWPDPWVTDQFVNLFTQRPFGTWYLNTLIVSVVSTVIAVVCAALSGYALARLRFKGNDTFTITILLTYVMPGALLFIPLYQLMSAARTVDSLWALIITYPTFTLPFATWLLMGYFRSIPVDLEEAALTDGCSRFQAFRKIVLPLAKPGILAVVLFTLTNAWNEFLLAFVFITKDSLKTLPVGMQSMIFGDVVPQGQLAAASLLISIPVVLMYALGQRFLTEGLTAGAVKG